MGSRWSVILEHYSKDNSWASQYLTNFYDSIPLFTDTSGGQINTAIIELNANGGKFIKTVGATTKIDHNDRIRITFADGITVGGYDQVFEVVRKLPMKSKNGTKLRIECEGIERHLQKIKYIKPHYFETPKNALIDLVNYYNANKTSSMPTLSIGTNELPDHGVHHFDWGINEESIYNRIIELVDLMGSASGIGGLLDFFDFRFTYSSVNVTSFTINVFSSGSPSNGNEKTIQSESVNTGEQSAGIEEAEGTIMGIWGGLTSGSLPIDYSRFRSKQQLLPTNNLSLYSPYDSSISYPSGSIVQNSGSTYISIQTVPTSTAPPNATYWTQLTTASHYGTVIQYSPWTNGKATLWKNSGADPLGTKSPYGAAMFDGNVIINDDTTFRTWVDVRTTGGAPSLYWTYGNSTSGYYDGLRVLVDGTGSGPFAGTDSNGISYTKNIVEYKNNEWVVKYDAFGDATLDSMQVAVFDEGRIYTWNNPTTGSWNDITSLDNGSDCFHNYDSIGQTTSVHIDPDTEAEYTSVNNGSGVKVVYSWSPLVDWAQDAFNSRTSGDYYQSGAWIGIRWPFPRNDLNGISEDVGDIYGGGIQGTTVKAPNAVDAQNMHLTHNGYRGFNTTSADSLESLDYGQLSSIDFFIKLIFTDAPLVGPTTELPKGNFKMRAWLFDKSDHVAYQDFVVQFNNNYESISLPLQGFQIYRGRRPRYDTNIIGLNDLIPPKGIAADEQFEFRHIVAFCIGTLESYDDFGRYQAGLNDFGLANIFLTTNRKLELWIDALRFTKPLLHVTDAVTGNTLVKMPDFEQQPEIGNFDQLENINKSNLEKAKFKLTEYDIESELKTDIHYGDYFYFTDPETVDASDGASNQIKLVNKGTEYSITKPENGRGGALRRIRGSKRFV